ncbi:TIGR02300 family protein [Paracoccus sp. S-4012]|uniref:FYDLN acid domain-containing protein n=1 Tax=Paracoccus sp. S-4012 TaxID=2665648 RepID=UPI0012AFD522|nr:FYDLN acid domain-containing protein [Paracoccus sp. S-4012]MRX51368.1 TIGR02300 family protein [Paracoccus sp. S-4012]
MPKEEWGTKRMCPNCGSRFYDLQNDPMTCPVCDAQFTVESIVSGRGRAMIADKAAARAGQDDDVVEADDDVEADAETEIDDDLLDDDDDDTVSLDEIADVESDEEEG